jgi:quercetin dioxygenase-like cupin family protein
MLGEYELLTPLKDLALQLEEAPIEPVHSRFPLDVCAELANAVEIVLSLDTKAYLDQYTIAFITSTGLLYPDSDDQIRELAGQNTAILQNLEAVNPLYAQLSRALVSQAHPRVSFSAYVSSRKSNRLGIHVDLWDNIVVQLSGSKTFYFDNDTVRLQTGDALSIPQGVPHDVTTDISSLHLSAVLLRQSWLNTLPLRSSSRRP